MSNMRELLNVGTEDITTLQTTLTEIRDERDRLQLRYNELGLSLVTAQEELEEARTLAGSNAVATTSMTGTSRRPDSEETGTGCAPQTTGCQHHFGIGRPVETLGLFQSDRSDFSDTCNTGGYSTHSSHGHPDKRSDHSTASRPTQFHVCWQR